MAMTLVSTVTIGSGGATQFEWANIPQTGKDLLVLFSIRDTVGNDTATLQFNSSTTGYAYRWLRNSGTGGASGSGAQNYLDSTMVPSNFTANTFSNFQMYVSNYTGSTDKVLSWDTGAEQNATASLLCLGSMIWANSAAITNLKFVAFSANSIAQHSSASLYIIS